MNILCLIGRHDWEFSYHHGIPLGASWELYDKMCKEGKTYSVDCCTRRGCSKQSRVIDGERIMLGRGQTENP